MCSKPKIKTKITLQGVIANKTTKEITLNNKKPSIKKRHKKVKRTKNRWNVQNTTAIWKI